MKAPTILACVSLVANAALGYLYWQRTFPAADSLPAHRASEAGVATKTGQAAGAASTPDRAAGATTSIPPVLDAPLAAALKSGDPKALVAALRHDGFPEKFIRDMVIWELGDTTKEKRYALLRAAIDRPFWRTESRAENLAWEKALDDLDAKNLPETKDVFSGAIPPLPQLTLAHRRLGFLPEDKIERVADLDNDYAAIARNAATSGGNNPESLALLEREKRADLAKILTPEELELYDLNLSPSALALRRKMTAFQPTEAEFRAMYDVRSVADAKTGAGAIGTPVSPAQRAADQSALNEQYRAILGDARFAEFQRGQDIGYRAAVEIVNHFNLPADNAAATYALQQSTQQRAQAIMQAAADPTAARTATQALVNETNAALTKLLGAPGADAYRQTGGIWLRALQSFGAGVPTIVRRPTGG